MSMMNRCDLFWRPAGMLMKQMCLVLLCYLLADLRNNGAVHGLLKMGFELFWENTTFFSLCKGCTCMVLNGFRV